MSNLEIREIVLADVIAHLVNHPPRCTAGWATLDRKTSTYLRREGSGFCLRGPGSSLADTAEHLISYDTTAYWCIVGH